MVCQEVIPDMPKSRSAKPKRRRPQRLAAKLVQIRKVLGLSQDGMLRLLGLEGELQRDYISKFERGILEPPLHVLCAYAQAANVLMEVLAKDDLDLPAQLPSKKRSEGVVRRL
jgi:transcriptional regulator with XRE-family HTH domain